MSENPSESLFEQAVYATAKMAQMFDDKDNPFLNPEFRAKARQASPEEKKRVVEVAVNGAIELIDEYKAAADKQAAQAPDPSQYDLDAISKKSGVKKGLVQLRDELKEDPSKLAEVADALFMFKEVTRRVAAARDGSLANERQSVDDGLSKKIDEISKTEGPDVAKRKVESGMALLRVGKAFLDDKKFSIRHYGEGVSSVPEYKAEHVRIVLDYADTGAEKTGLSARILAEKMQKTLGSGVVIDYGVADREGKPFVILRGKDGPLQNYDLQALAETAEANLGKGQSRINRGGNGELAL
jgi:hypothetical protein